MAEPKKEYIKTRNELPKKLEQILFSVKEFDGEYEYERDYLKVFEKIKHTNPFSILVFYESPDKEISLTKIKKLNPNIPERILSFMASYTQFYFIPELKEKRIGTYLGSGYRSTQSVYVLALALLSEKKNVPTHILISDRKNIIKHVLSNEKLIVQPHEVTQTVNIEFANKILKDTIKAYDIMDERSIESIYLVTP